MMDHHVLFPRTVRQHVNQTFGEQWIGRGGLVNWPARSPDLISLDIWLWGHRQNSVFSTPINDLEVLQHRVENASHEIPMKSGILGRVRRSVRRRAAGCVEMHGNHKERLLQRTHEHRPYLNRH
jgi:hypothetical protein